MKNYLEKKLGEKLGVVRAGLPKEVYFEAKLTGLDDEVAVFEDERGREIVVPLNKILMLGPSAENLDDRGPMGFAKG